MASRNPGQMFLSENNARTCRFEGGTTEKSSGKDPVIK